MIFSALISSVRTIIFNSIFFINLVMTTHLEIFSWRSDLILQMISDYVTIEKLNATLRKIDKL